MDIGLASITVESVAFLFEDLIILKLYFSWVLNYQFIKNIVRGRILIVSILRMKFGFRLKVLTIFTSISNFIVLIVCNFFFIDFMIFLSNKWGCVCKILIKLIFYLFLFFTIIFILIFLNYRILFFI